jgi:hypothetical protein
MELIYANAAVTIIAAAGEGPDHGLPGVAGTLRKPGPSLKIGACHITSTLAHGKNVVPRSKWATRGWTYQEVILSKRRLIFTDHQIFWECNSMYSAEAIQIYLDDQLSVDDQRQTLQVQEDGIFSKRTPGTVNQDFLHYVAQFRKRDLTYESDSINALSGIFRAFEKGEKPMYQLMGVPVYFSDHFQDKANERKTTSRIACQGFLMGLTWQHATPRRERVPMFPSWSWAGWKGRIYKNASLGLGPGQPKLEEI